METESWPLIQFSDLKQYIDPETLEWRAVWVLLRKDFSKLPKMYTISLFPSIPQRDPRSFTRRIVYWRKWNNQTFQGLLHTCSEPQIWLWPPIRVGVYGGQIIHGVLVQVHLTVNPRIWPVVISPVLQCIIGIDILSWWKKPSGSY